MTALQIHTDASTALSLGVYGGLRTLSVPSVAAAVGRAQIDPREK